MDPVSMPPFLDQTTNLSMIRSHSTCPNSPKRQRLDTQLQKAFVDGHSSARGLPHENFLNSFVFREDVHRQRLVSIVDESNGVPSRVDRHNGKDRTENFFLHDRVVWVDFRQNCQLDESLCFVTFAAYEFLEKL